MVGGLSLKAYPVRRKAIVKKTKLKKTLKRVIFDFLDSICEVIFDFISVDVKRNR